MSTYCVSDLHGRYDLFLGILDEINFNIICEIDNDGYLIMHFEEE